MKHLFMILFCVMMQAQASTIDMDIFDTEETNEQSAPAGAHNCKCPNRGCRGCTRR